jgi:hypothetical protein
MARANAAATLQPGCFCSSIPFYQSPAALLFVIPQRSGGICFSRAEKVLANRKGGLHRLRENPVLLKGTASAVP